MATVEDLLAGTGSRSAKFETAGTTHKGTIITVDVVQARDIDGNPKTWDDGNPVEQLRVILQTVEHDDDDDDGRRTIYLKGGTAAKDGARTSLEAVKEALKTAGAKTIELGGELAVQYVCDGERSKAAYNPPKLYKAQYKAPAPPAVDAGGLL